MTLLSGVFRQRPKQIFPFKKPNFTVEDIQKCIRYIYERLKS